MTITMTNAAKLAIGDSVRALALSYARKTGVAIDTVVLGSADAKHEFSLAPIKLYHAIKNNLTAEDVDALPRPGSKFNDDGMENQLPDIAEWKDPSKPDGKAKEISFYVTWSDNTPEGARVVTELDYISRLSSENMKTDDIPKAFKDKYCNPQLLKKHKKYLDGRRATIRKQYKDAVRLIWQLDMVNDLDGCGAELDEDQTENTVRVFNKAKPLGEYKFYSIGAFLKLDPLKASETDGSYAALELTAKRGTAEDATPGTKPGTLALNSVRTPESSDKVAVVWHSYLHEAMNDRKGDKYAALIRHLTSDAGRQAVLTMAGIRDCLNGIFAMDQIKTIADIEKDKLAKAA